VWLEGDMNTNMRGDMISLDSSGPALIPLARQVEVVSALATDMFLANVLIKSLGGVELFKAVIPAADERLICSGGA